MDHKGGSTIKTYEAVGDSVHHWPFFWMTFPSGIEIVAVDHVARLRLLGLQSRELLPGIGTDAMTETDQQTGSSPE